MRVKYEIFNEESYTGYCAMLDDLYPNAIPPSIEEYTEIGTGEIAGFIKGGFFLTICFLLQMMQPKSLKK